METRSGVDLSASQKKPNSAKDADSKNKLLTEDQITLDSVTFSESTDFNSTSSISKKLSRKKSVFNVDQVRIDDIKLDNIIFNSSLADTNPAVQVKNVLAAFNVNVKKGQSAFETSYVFGELVRPNQYILGACNQRPELRFHDGALNIRRGWFINPAINSEIKKIVEQSALFFGAYGSYVLNVPVNSYAKAMSGNIPLIFGSGPHVIHDANFKFDPIQGLVDQADSYINHDSIHILRVPAGKIAKIWIGATPYLLESREEAYVFNTSLFKFVPKSGNDLFFSATEDLITHGSIKRVMPRTGKVAISYNNGNLEIIKPNENGKPTIINSASHDVSNTFLDTNVQAYVFPSQEEIDARRRDNKNMQLEELHNYVYMTKDSLKIGVKLLVSYRISNPHLTLSQLGENKILSTVENLAAVDMNRMVNQLTFQDFLNPTNFLDEIKKTLTTELAEYGIELKRFNVETPVILDKVIAGKMAECATMTADANAKQAIIQRQAQVQEAEAIRDAKTKHIEQDQSNQAVISKAEAALKAQEFEAKAVLAKAQAEADAMKVKATAEAEAIESIGKAYMNNPHMCELKKTEYMTKAMAKMGLVVPYPAQSLHHVMDASNYASCQRLFGGTQPEAGKNMMQQLMDDNPETGVVRKLN